MNVYIELQKTGSVLDMIGIGGGYDYHIVYRCLVCKTILTTESSVVVPAPGSLLHHPVQPGCAYSDRMFNPPVFNLIEVK